MILFSTDERPENLRAHHVENPHVNDYELSAAESINDMENDEHFNSSPLPQMNENQGKHFQTGIK